MTSAIQRNADLLKDAFREAIDLQQARKRLDEPLFSHPLSASAVSGPDGRTIVQEEYEVDGMSDISDNDRWSEEEEEDEEEEEEEDEEDEEPEEETVAAPTSHRSDPERHRMMEEYRRRIEEEEAIARNADGGGYNPHYSSKSHEARMREKYDAYWDNVRRKTSGRREDTDMSDAASTTSDRGNERFGDPEPTRINGNFIRPPDTMLMQTDDPVVSLDVHAGIFGGAPKVVFRNIRDCHPSTFIDIRYQFTNYGGRKQTLESYAFDRIDAYVEKMRAIGNEDYDGGEADDEDIDGCGDGGRESYEERMSLAEKTLTDLSTRANNTAVNNQYCEYVPCPHPRLAERQQVREQRRRRDGCLNIARVQENCHICEQADAENVTRDVASPEVIGLYSLWSELSTRRNKESVWKTLALYWNKHFVDGPISQGRTPGVQRLTPSHMEIHFMYCVATNMVPSLVEDLLQLELAAECAIENGLYTEKRVAGKRTGIFAVSKMAHQELRQNIMLREKLNRQLTNYAMIGRLLSGSAFSPLPGMLMEAKQLKLGDVLRHAPKQGEDIEAIGKRVLTSMWGLS